MIFLQAPASSPRWRLVEVGARPGRSTEETSSTQSAVLVTHLTLFFSPVSIHGNKKTWESLPGELSNYREELSSIVRWAYNWTTIVTRYPQFSVVAVTVNDEGQLSQPSRGLSLARCRVKIKINVQSLNDTSDISSERNTFLSTFIANIYIYMSRVVNEYGQYVAVRQFGGWVSSMVFLRKKISKGTIDARSVDRCYLLPPSKTTGWIGSDISISSKYQEISFERFFTVAPCKPFLGPRHLANSAN